MNQLTPAELFEKFINNACSPEEVDQLMTFLQDERHAALREELISKQLLTDLEPAGYSDPVLQQRLQHQLELITQRIHPDKRKPARLWQLTWARIAAAVLVLVLVGGLYYSLHRRTQLPATTATQPMAQNDVKPGGDRAVLTLDDGKQIVLDSATNGTLAQQGDVHIIKEGNGLMYHTGTNATIVGKPLYNTMTTPRGGQYQLTLPDGTAVWLNAASSIRYPIAFTGDTRSVSVTGEVYFEVKPSKTPFVVNVQKAGSNGEAIRVLGTHFNINAYDDEGTIATTLLEGKISVANTVLQPGQQAQLSDGDKTIKLAGSVDLAQVMAWKNHLFNFNNVSLKEVMRQLSRWYDIEIDYAADAPVTDLYTGELQRNLNLFQVLKGLGSMGLHFKVEGRRLLILP